MSPDTSKGTYLVAGQQGIGMSYKESRLITGGNVAGVVHQA